MPPRKCNTIKTEAAKPTKRICLPLNSEEHAKMVEDIQYFRKRLDEYIACYPELFPSDIGQGYQLHGMTEISAKLPEARMRRIRLNELDEQGRAQVYTIAPSFVLPYMVGYTDEVEKALFAWGFNVPFWGLTYLFGRDDMYWQRLVSSLGRHDIVGTTVKDPAQLPEHLLADEKHTRLNGEKVYLATTGAEGCVLGISLALAANQQELTEAYGHFKEEAQRINPDYQPLTVNTDGWLATQQAWQKLFSSIVVILCFLHAFLSIRSRGKHLKETFHAIAQHVWNIYHTIKPDDFLQQVTNLRAWAHIHVSGPTLEAILKLCDKASLFILAFDYPGAYRTSNMLDRLMDPLDRWLYAARYFHGHLMSAEYQSRAWTLLHNFRLYCPRADIRQLYLSPFHQLNGFVYHDNWLHNLLIAASLGGRHAPHRIR
jgi:hypothetical protein